MRIKARHLTILTAAFLAVVLPAAVSHGYGSLTDTRPRISEAEIAVAWISVQNVMSKHSYYYAVNNRLEELSNIWVSENGEYADTATFTTIDGVWQGMDLIKLYYGNPAAKDEKQSIKEMSKSNPWEATKGQFAVSMNTTPIIEVAGDGKTARGVWFSPAIIMNYTGQKDKSGNDIAEGTCYFQKYGADFVKEDGAWKIWHLQTYTDFTPSVGSESNWTTPDATGKDKKDQKSQAQGDAGVPKASWENPDPYEKWSPERENKLRPEIPEPYYTFDETTNF